MGERGIKNMKTNCIEMRLINKEGIIRAIEKVYASKHKAINIRSTTKAIRAVNEKGENIFDAILGTDGVFTARVQGHYMTELYDALSKLREEVQILDE